MLLVSLPNLKSMQKMTRRVHLKWMITRWASQSPLFRQTLCSKIQTRPVHRRHLATSQLLNMNPCPHLHRWFPYLLRFTCRLSPSSQLLLQTEVYLRLAFHQPCCNLLLSVTAMDCRTLAKRQKTKIAQTPRDLKGKLNL